VPDDFFNRRDNAPRAAAGDPEQATPSGASDATGDVAALHRLTLATLTEGVVVFDTAGRVLICNPAAESILGEGAAALCADTPAGGVRFWREDGAPLGARDLPPAHTLRSGQPCREVVVDRGGPDGAPRWLHIKAEPLFDDATGAVSAVVTSLADVSEPHRLEQAGRERDALLGSIMAQVPIGIVLIDPETQGFIEFNDAACAGLGYDRETFGRLRLCDLGWDGLDEAGIHHRLAEIQRRTRWNFEIRCTHADGRPRDLSVYNQAVLHRGQSCVVAIWHDRTEANAAARVLAEEQARLRILLDTLPEMIWLKDPAGVFRICNRAFVRSVGGTEAEVIGRTDETFYPPDQVRQFRASDRRAMEAGGPVQFEEWVDSAATGRRHRLETTKIPMIDAAGRLSGVLGIGRDVTPTYEARQALAESERRKQLALDTARAGIWDWRLGAGADFWSDEMWDLHGLTPGGHSPGYAVWLASFHSDDRGEVAKTVDDAVRRGAEFEGEWRVATPEGAAARWLLVRGRPIQDKDGRVERYLCISLDVSSRKQAETLLRQWDFILRQGQGMARMMSWRADLVAQTFEADTELDFLSGVPPKKKTFDEVYAQIHPDDLPHMRASWEATQRTGAGYDIEHRMFIDGAVRWVHAKAMITEAAAGRPLSAIGMTQDITDRKQAEERIRDLADRVSLATKAAGIGIWEFDLRTQRRIWSDEVFRICGLDVGDGLPPIESWRSVVHPGDQEWFERDLNLTISTGHGDLVTGLRILRPTGEVRHIKLGARVHRDAAGQPVRVLGSMIDVTDHHRALEDLQRAKEMAEQASVAKSTFISAMSHELRTPLNAIIGFTELLQNLDPRPDQVERLEIIATAANSLLHLINDILVMSKVEAGKVAVRVAPFDLHRELESVINQFGVDATARSLSLRATIAPDVPRRVRGDSGLVRQVLVNLIGNALKFTLDGGIDVRLERDPRPETDDVGSGCVPLCFHVRDTGIGIRPENHARIFEMFEQEDGTMTRRFAGSGLGLAISRRLVARMGGEIRLDSAPGGGSCFSFSIPFTPADPD